MIGVLETAYELIWYMYKFWGCTNIILNFVQNLMKDNQPQCLNSIDEFLVCINLLVAHPSGDTSNDFLVLSYPQRVEYISSISMSRLIMSHKWLS